jgi:LmbE family N-acetylglucosaminyl deacetylase
MTTKSVLAIAAHPDDIEFVMSGTMMRLKAVGYELHYFNIANGCCGSTQTDAATTAKIREAEARRASEMLGATFYPSIANDLEIFYQRDLLLKVASVVRQAQPSIVLTHSPQDYMEDHMNACRLAVTAAFARGMPNFPVDPPCDIMPGAITVYHAQPHGNCDGIMQPIHPDLYVDVTELDDRKTQLLACHASQKQWLDESQGMDSYLEAMKDLLREVGRLSGKYALAEGWRRHSHLGFCAAEDDPLRTALVAHCADA